MMRKEIANLRQRESRIIIVKKRNEKNQVSKEKKTEEEEKWSLTVLNQDHFRKPPTPHALLLSWRY